MVFISTNINKFTNTLRRLQNILITIKQYIHRHNVCSTVCNVGLHFRFMQWFTVVVPKARPVGGQERAWPNPTWTEPFLNRHVRKKSLSNWVSRDTSTLPDSILGISFSILIFPVVQVDSKEIKANAVSVADPSRAEPSSEEVKVEPSKFKSVSSPSVEAVK